MIIVESLFKNLSPSFLIQILQFSQQCFYGQCLFWCLTFQRLTFWQKTFRHINFITGTFWHKNIWTQGYLNISAYVHFGTMQSNIDFLVKTFWHGCPCAKMFMFQSILVPKYSSILICLHAKTCMVPKHTYAKMSSWQNVFLRKSPLDEMSVPKCLLPKCQVPK